jgi:hypothetical protein
MSLHQTSAEVWPLCAFLIAVLVVFGPVPDAALQRWRQCRRRG